MDLARATAQPGRPDSVPGQSRSRHTDPAPGGHYAVVVIGSGMGGICAAIKLKGMGVDSLAVLERADEVGGTWRANTYPGIAVDTSILQYSLSFEPNPGWSRLYAGGAELQRYLIGLSEKYGIRRHIRFGTDVTEMRYAENEQLWQISTRSGATYTANVVVNATGHLSTPSIPSIPGLDQFEGQVLHSAEWDASFDASGRRIAAIGSGASAAQLVPCIARDAEQVYVYQRSAPWVFPRDDRPIGRIEAAVYRHVPFVLRAQRWRRFWGNDKVAYAFEKQNETVAKQQRYAEDFIERSIPDPELRRAVTPDYSVGCKRRIMSDDWYPTLLRENVELIPSALTEVRPRSVVGPDGVERPVDTIVFSTGFAVEGFMPMKVFGTGGTELHDAWSDGAQTHLGITVSGYPNLFLISGPNTAIGAGSYAFMIECQVRYITGALELMRRRGLSALDVRLDVQRRSYWKTQSRLSGSVYGSGCEGWYQGEGGRIDTLWPGTNAEYWWRTRRFDPKSYHLVTRAPIFSRSAAAASATTIPAA